MREFSSHLEEQKKAAIDEAFDRLGYLVEAAKPTIMAFLQDRLSETPRALTTRYRRNGHQLEKEEQRELGIRTNAFMSTEAFYELTTKGRAIPLAAHEITLSRVQFSLGHIQTVAANEFEFVKLRGSFSFDCEICASMSDMAVRTRDAPVFEFDGCKRDVCGLFLLPILSSWVGFSERDESD